MSKVLITGGLGFVGGRLAKKLSNDFEVMISSRITATQEVLALHGTVTPVLHHDLLSKETFPTGVDTVIHLAALNEIDCVQYPSEAIRVNVDETRMILESSIASEVKNFIYFSTAHIYGSPLRGVITEGTIPVPVHPYAITHKAAEDYVLAAAHQKKIRSKVIRLSNSFGAPVNPAVNRWTLVANDLSRQVIEGGRLTLMSNGCQLRDFICLTDVENVIHDMVSRNQQVLSHAIYNLGSGVATPVIDMANRIADNYEILFNRKIPVVLPAGAVATDEPPLHFSIDRLQSDGFVVKNDVNEELKQLLMFCHKNFKSVD